METRKVDLLIRFSDEKMQKIPLFDSEKYFCDLYCLRSGQDQRIHSHPDSDKIYFVLRGKGTFHIAGQEKELGRRCERFPCLEERSRSCRNPGGCESADPVRISGSTDRKNISRNQIVEFSASSHPRNG